MSLRSLVRTSVFALVAIGSAIATSQTAHTQSSGSVVHAFYQQPSYAISLMQASDGSFYGTLWDGGDHGAGGIYALDPQPDGSFRFRMVHHFDDAVEGHLSSNNPSALVQGPDGALYGTTDSYGPAYGGSIFRVTPSGDFTVLRQGDNPHGTLLVTLDGELIGTAQSGGASGYGYVFRVAIDGSGFESLHDFNYLDGFTPRYGVVRASDGTLYGTTAQTPTGFGEVFAISPSGDFSVLHQFPNNFSTGVFPGGLVVGPDGNVYGTTSSGGPAFRGNVFKIDTATGAYSVVHTRTSSDGEFAESAMVVGPDGAMYGHAVNGGPDGAGLVYRVTTGGTYSIVHSFMNENRYPQAPPVSSGGRLFGATFYGDVNVGSVYSMFPDGSDFRTEHQTSSGSDPLLPSSGLTPLGGSWYGVTERGGANGYGVIYRITASQSGGVIEPYNTTLSGSQSFEVVHDFDGSANSPAGLISGSDGVLYGVAQIGGVFGNGGLYAFAPGGGFTLLHSFDYSTDGYLPFAVTEGPDGRLYGLTRNGGEQNGGTAFRLNKDGSGFSILHAFPYNFSSNGIGDLKSSLIVDADGTLTGLTGNSPCFIVGCAYPNGVIYRIAPDATLRVLVAFDSNTYPSSLVRAANGELFGTQESGGDFGGGAIFTVSSGGAYSFVHSFDYAAEYAPRHLSSAADGLLYGVAYDGATGNQTVFSVDPAAGSYANLANVPPAIGQGVVAPPAADCTGRLYLVGGNEGPSKRGSVFTVPIPAFQPCGSGDTTPPVILVPNAITAEATSADGASVAFDVSAVDPDNGPVPVTCVIGDGDIAPKGEETGPSGPITSPAAFPLGVTTVTCTAVDASNNIGTNSFTVTVVDTTPPVIAVTNFTEIATVHAGAAVTFEPAPSAIDTVSGAITPECGATSGATFPIGDTVVTCTASDEAGNEASATFTVQVLDGVPPTIGLPATINVTAYSVSGVAVPYIVTVSDSEGSATVACAPASGSIFLPGLTAVNCTATDSNGVQSFGSFNVNVTLADNRIGRFVAFSRDYTWLRANATVVTGDVGANERKAHAHDSDPEDGDQDDVVVRVGQRAEIRQAGSRVVGSTTLLDNRSKVHDVLANFVIDRPGAIVLGTITTPMAVPYLALPVFPSVTAGTVNRTVAKNQTVTLAAGAYGHVEVKQGGRLILTGGLYQVRSLDVDQGGSVIFAAPTELRIKTELHTRSKSKLILDQSVSGLKAADMVIYVEGTDASCGHDASADDDGDHAGKAVAHIGQNSQVQANIFAKNGTVWLKSKTTATGSFIGQHVRIGQSVTLTLDSAFK